MFFLVRIALKFTKERASRLLPGNSVCVYRSIRIFWLFRGRARYIVPLQLVISKLLIQRQIAAIMPLR
jgi:hypothetical protein